MTRSANHWLHYRLHFRRNALTQTNEAQRRRVGTATATLFTQVTVPRRSQAAIERGRDKLQRLAASTCCGRVSAALASPRSRLAAQSNPLHRATKHLGQLRRTVERQRQRAVYAGKVAPERGRRRDEITADVFDNIERFYNPTRRHSAPGSVSPIALEKAHRAQVGVNGFGSRPLQFSAAAPTGATRCGSRPPYLYPDLIDI